MNVIECSGNFREMGRTQGIRYKSWTDKIFKTLLDSYFTPVLLKKFGTAAVLKHIFSIQGMKYYPLLNWKLNREVPSQYQRMCGIAEGSSMHIPTVLALNAVEMFAARIRFVLGCSAIGFDSSRLEEGLSPILAYNHDFPPFFGDFIILRKSVPKNRRSSLQLTYPVLAGAIAGVNNCGLSATLNHAFAVEKEGMGIPPSMLLQEVLDSCGSTAEAIRVLKKSRPACGSLITLVDSKGDMAAVELSQTRIAVRKAKNGLILAINRYETAALKKIEIPQNAFFDPKKFPAVFHGIPIHNANWSRAQRFESLLAKKGRFRVEEIESILKDHDSNNTPAQTTICRHHGTASTLASAIMDPKNGIIRVLKGNPCKRSYMSYTI